MNDVKRAHCCWKFSNTEESLKIKFFYDFFQSKRRRLLCCAASNSSAENCLLSMLRRAEKFSGVGGVNDIFQRQKHSRNELTFTSQQSKSWSPIMETITAREVSRVLKFRVRFSIEQSFKFVREEKSSRRIKIPLNSIKSPVEMKGLRPVRNINF